MARAEAVLASSAGPRHPTQAIFSAGQRALQPATVSGPQHTSPFSISRQLFSRILHSVQTGYWGNRGGFPFSRWETAEMNCSFSMGQPLMLRSTFTTWCRARAGVLS